MAPTSLVAPNMPVMINGEGVLSTQEVGWGWALTGAFGEGGSVEMGLFGTNVMSGGVTTSGGV